MRTKKGLAGASLFALVLRCFGALSGFALTISVSRFLGAEEAGRLFLGIAVANFLAAIACLGLDKVALRYVGMYSAEKAWGAVNSSIALSLRVALAVGGIFGLICFFGSNYIATALFNDVDFAPVLRSISPSLQFLAGCLVLAQSFLGLGKVAASIFITLIGVQAGLTGALFVVDNAIMGGLVFSILWLGMLGFALMCWRWFTPKQFAQDFDVPSIMRIGPPLWMVTLMANLQQWGGQFVAGAMLQSADVALVAAASRITFIVSFFLMATNMVVAPKFAALYKQGAMADLRDLSHGSVKLILAVSLPLFCFLFWFADSLMRLFGSEFARGGAVLQILLIGQLVNAGTGSVGVLLSMCGHEKDARNVALLTTPLALISAIILAMHYGLVGIAIGFSLGMVVQNITSAYCVRRRLGFWTFLFWR